MAAIAHQLGLADDVKRYNDRAERLIELMNATFWDEADGMYYDRNEKTGKLVKVKSATCFMPLFAGAATPDRARRTLREYYDAETGLGLGQTRFWGFTALYYGMRLEWQLRYDASSLDKRIEPIVARNLGVAFEG
jgi:hypothetical protein